MDISWRLSHKLARFNPIPANARWVECDDHGFPIATAEGPGFLLARGIEADDFGEEGLSLSNADLEYTVTYSITGWGHTHRCTCKRWATSAPGPLAYCPKCSSMGSWVPFTEPPPKIPESWMQKG